jgi:hypothetical protein
MRTQSTDMQERAQQLWRELDGMDWSSHELAITGIMRDALESAQEENVVTHAAKSTEELWLYSMGKRFQVRMITTSDDEANEFMGRHDEVALIACFGPFKIIANKYAGVSECPNTTR